MGTITKNFSFHEFRCHCRQPCLMSDGTAIDLGLVHKLQSIRDVYGVLRVTSGCRCIAHNNAVSGALTSQHLAVMGCKAADIQVKLPGDRAVLVRLALREGLTVGVSKNFIHMDNRKKQILFLY